MLEEAELWQSVLLHLRDGKTAFNPHKWAFFGGSNEGSETPAECFIRELEEEIGLRIPPGAVKKLLDYPNKKVGRHRYIFYAISDVDPSTLTLGEGAGFAWVPLARVSEYALTELTKNDLDYFIANERHSLKNAGAASRV